MSIKRDLQFSICAVNSRDERLSTWLDQEDFWRTELNNRAYDWRHYPNYAKLIAFQNTITASLREGIIDQQQHDALMASLPDAKELYKTEIHDPFVARESKRLGLDDNVVEFPKKLVQSVHEPWLAFGETREEYKKRIDERYAKAYPNGTPGTVQTTRLDQVTPTKIDWIWPGRLALGKHTAVAGVGGKGKSQLGYGVAAMLTNGKEMPDGGHAPQGSVLLISAEDDKADMMVPRLMAAGADLSKCHTIDKVFLGSGAFGRFNLQRDMEAVYLLCRKIGDVMAIICDPIGSFLGGTLDTHRDAALRDALDPINDIIAQAKVGFMSVQHFNKGRDAKAAADRVMGGAAFVNAPRCALGFYVDPENADARLLLPIKTNLSRPPAGLRCHVEETEIGDGILAPFLVWDGTTDTTAEDLIADEGERQTPALDKAVAFLAARLADGNWHESDKVNTDAVHAGIKFRTLATARKKLGVISRKDEDGWRMRLRPTADEDFGQGSGA